MGEMSGYSPYRHAEPSVRRRSSACVSGIAHVPAPAYAASRWVLLALGACAAGCFPEETLSSYMGGVRSDSIGVGGSGAGTDAGVPAPVVDAGLVEVPDAEEPEPAPPPDAGPERALVCREECVCERLSGRDYMFCPTPVTFAVAQGRCDQAGGALASVDDAEENVRLSQGMQALEADDFWLSGTDTQVEGVWRWQDGRVFFDLTGTADAGAGSFVPWDVAQPNDVNGEDCMRSIEGLWRDLDCGDEIAYVCQG